MTTYTNEKAAGAFNVNGLHTDARSSNFRSHGAINQVRVHDGKDIAHLIARLELAGHRVINGDQGHFACCKFGLTHHCTDFAKLAEFAKKLGCGNE